MANNPDDLKDLFKNALEAEGIALITNAQLNYLLEVHKAACQLLLAPHDGIPDFSRDWDALLKLLES